jgi:membrane protein implicated in regulation of membrane protease activity
VAAVFWLILGIVLILAEVLSGDFVLIMLGGGALAAALSSALGGSLVVDALVFAVVSVALLLLARPVLRRRLHRSVPHAPIGIEALVGSPAVVVSRVDSHGGQVKIGGDVWSARSDHGQVIEPGQRVTVMQISGATAVVLAQD